MANPYLKKYPTPWQRKTMRASLTAVFVVTLVGIVSSVIWLAGNLVAFLQPILIPVAIAVILAYLLDPLVTYLGERGYGRTKAIGALFTIAFFALAAVLTWIVPSISMRSANVANELPAYTSRARDKVVDLIYRYNNTFGTPATGRSKATSTASNLVNWLLASPTPTPAAEKPVVVISPQPDAPPSPDTASSVADRPRRRSLPLRSDSGSRNGLNDNSRTFRHSCRRLPRSFGTY